MLTIIDTIKYFNSKIPHRLIVIGLFLLSLAIRLLFINKGFFHHDSILLIEAVEKSIDQKTIAPLLEGRYAYVAITLPFYLIAQALHLPADLSLNVMTAVFASLSVTLIYGIAWEITKSQFCAVSAAIILSLTPVYFSASTHTMVHPVSVCMALLSFYLIILGNNRSCIFFVLATIALILAISIRFPNILIIPSFGLAYFKPKFGRSGIRINKDKFGKDLACVGLPLVVGLGLIYGIQKDALIAKAGYDTFLGILSPMLKVSLENLLTNFGLVGCTLLAIGLYQSIYEEEQAYILASLLWLAIMLFFYGNIRSYADRFLCILFPQIALFIALALNSISRHSKIVSFLILLYLVTNMFLVVYPVVRDRHLYSGEKDFALWLGEKTEKNSVIISMDENVFIRYYAHRQTIGHPQGSVHYTNEWVARLYNLLTNGTPVYIIDSGFSYDPGQIVQTAIFNNFNLTYIGSHKIEDYHKASLKRKVYQQRLFKLFPKNSSVQN